MTTTSTLTSKGQITIPIEIRTALGLEIGDRIQFIETAKGHYSILAATKSIKSLKGVIAKRSKPVSIREMNAAITAQGASAR